MLVGQVVRGQIISTMKRTRLAETNRAPFCTNCFPREDYTPENGCLAVSFFAVTSEADGSPFIARAMDSFVAS